MNMDPLQHTTRIGCASQKSTAIVMLIRFTNHTLISGRIACLKDTVTIPFYDTRVLPHQLPTLRNVSYFYETRYGIGEGGAQNQERIQA